MTYRKNKSRGFTLIELMIAIVIVGILTAIAVPNFTGYMREARRTDAIVMLLEVAGEQEKFYSENNAYADKMGVLGYGAVTANTVASPDGHYNVTVSAQTAGTFTLTAAPVANGAQDGDTCGSFSITNTGGKSVSGTETKCWD